MANQPELTNYEAGIYQLEKLDPVLGGVGGKSNLPLLQLANRTAWLKQAIENLESGGGPFEYNASAGTLPVGGSDGPGVAGIRRKDYYFVTVAGTVSGVSLQIGDALIAKEDDANVIGNFIISQANSELATPTVIGMVKLVQNLTGGSQADAVLSVAGLINLFAKLDSPVLTGAPKAPTAAAGENSTVIANTAWVLARLVALNDSLVNAISSEATARGNADTAEANARSSADNALNSAKADKSIQIATNGGLQGGGDLAANRTLSILDGGVSTQKLADNAVTTPKIGNAQVTAAKLATDVNDKWRGNGVRTDEIVDFTNYQGLASKTYSRVLWTMSRNNAFIRPYVKVQFQAKRDSGGVDRIQCLLQRNSNPDGGGTWSTIQNIIYRLDGDSWTTCILDTVDTLAGLGDNYYRVVCNNIEGTGNHWSDDWQATIFGIPVF